MAHLCIDIGNTTTDYGLLANGTVIAGGSLPTAKLSEPNQGLAARLADLCPESPPYSWQGLAFCSVVPQAVPVVCSLPTGGEPVLQLTWQDCPGLPIHVERPEEVGQDRLANAIAAQARLGTPCIVIDMGTAVTLDIITDRGYEGGLIAPGLEVMTRYLHDQTALLPRLDPGRLETDATIGKTTVQAMQLGCTVGLAGMIRGLLDWVHKILKQSGNETVNIALTGGSRRYLPATWLQEIEYIPHLTLLGLAEAYHRKFSHPQHDRNGDGQGSVLD